MIFPADEKRYSYSSFMNTSFFIFILLPISLCFAAGTNRTIDDGLGDVITGLQVEYLPLNSPNNTGEPFWKHEDQCNGCAILPDRTKAFDETWTATTYFPVIEYMSIGFRFSGKSLVTLGAHFYLKFLVL